MPSLNFQKRFVPRIQLGKEDSTLPDAKTHTIRAPRKDHRDPKPGQPLHLFTGLRQSGATRLHDEDHPPVCTRVDGIVIRKWRGQWEIWIGPKPDLPFNSNEKYDAALIEKAANFPAAYGLSKLDGYECGALALRDGFGKVGAGERENFADMMRFWEGREKFFGYMIHWRWV